MKTSTLPPDPSAAALPEDAAPPDVDDASQGDAQPPEPVPPPADAAPPDGDAPDDAALDALDALEELGEEIRALSAHLHAGTRRLLSLVARFDAGGGWKLAGHRDCAHWLSFETGVTLRTAREYVRVAGALTELPATDASMARGTLSFDQVRAVTRVATAETEADLLVLAEGAAPAVLERECRAWKTRSRADEAERERERHESRRLALFPDGDGMHRLDGRLIPEVGASFGKALDRARFDLYARIGKDAWKDDPREALRRNADALGLVAEWALCYREGGRLAAAGDSADRGPVSGTRAQRFQVLLHVDADTLSADREPGRSELEDGTRLAAETARRLSCDCALVRVERHPETGDVLNVGRSTRSIPPALRRALEIRDRGCRFPGCGNRFTDGHHAIHWANAGETSLANTFLLCRMHHRLVHEGGWRAEFWGRDRHLVFIDPRGQAHSALRRPLPAPEPGQDPVRELVLANAAAGSAPGARAPRARWRSERDIPDDVLFRALEATAPG